VLGIVLVGGPWMGVGIIALAFRWPAVRAARHERQRRASGYEADRG
jgi:hypothetical protein